MAPASAVEGLAELGAIVVAHHGELEVDRLDAVELCSGLGDASLDLALERAPGDGQRDQDPDDTVLAHRDAAEHAEVDDRSVEFGILHRAECLDDLLFGHDGGHGLIVATTDRICTGFALRP